MDTRKLHEAALESSRKVLVDHFDWEAYLVYSTAQRSLSELDIVPDSDVDDSIKEIFNDFVRYYKVKQSGSDSTAELSAMMLTVRRMIAELLCQATAAEKIIIKERLSGVLDV